MVDGSPPTLRHGSGIGRRVGCWQTSTGENDGRAQRGVNESVPGEGQRVGPTPLGVWWDI